MSGPGPAGTTAVAAGVLATAAGALPAFLTGALGVQLQEELRFDDVGLGIAVAAFFGASALASGPAGALAERIGPRRAVRLGTTGTAAVLAGTAAVVQTWALLVVALALAGTANALIQPSVNAVLMRAAAVHRRGLAFGVKQAGVPTATLLGGMSVPLLAVTAGWRAAYLAGAGVAVAAAWAVHVSAGTAPREPKSRGLLTPELLMLAVGTGLGSATGSVLGVFLVPGAVAAGMSPVAAGWVLTVGSVTAIAVRIGVGWHADRGGGRLPVVAGMLAGGACGFSLLALRHPVALLAAVPLAFGCGWGWNGLLHFSVADAHPDRAAAATGVTQAGVYTGATVGPAAFGLTASSLGVPAAWLLTAAASLVAAGLILASSRTGTLRPAG